MSTCELQCCPLRPTLQGFVRRKIAQRLLLEAARDRRSSGLQSPLCRGEYGASIPSFLASLGLVHSFGGFERRAQRNQTSSIHASISARLVTATSSFT
ncbi:hypothetical protein TYRP_004752 [Tyrophagus putrescentiae]|nr:hypothetical protein TYRP_004752 [Tyrophagus putrescentiae]